MLSGMNNESVYGMDAGRMLSSYLELARSEEYVDPVHRTGDVVEISREAIRRFEDDQMKPMAQKSMSLEKIDQRISAIRAEIESIWNSPLPDDQKMMQISSRKNEISLLQAGQFEFARNGFYA